MLKNSIIKYMAEKNLFNPGQHGFRLGRSCLSQLVAHYDNIIRLLLQNVDVESFHKRQYPDAGTRPKIFHSENYWDGAAIVLGAITCPVMERRRERYQNKINKINQINKMNEMNKMKKMNKMNKLNKINKISKIKYVK